MPVTINRTPFNATADDTSVPPGTNGTVIDKALLVSILFDPIDVALAAIGSGGGWSVATTSTVTGAQNNWAPGLSGNTYVRWNGASDAAFTGIAGGVAGQLLTVENIGTKVATFAHQSGSSSAGNKLRNIALSAPTPIAPGGILTYQYDGTDWQLIAHEQGAWITPAYAGGNFTGNGSMTWTVDAGDVTTLKYRLSGRALTVAFDIVATTVGGTLNSDLRIAMPGGFTQTNDQRPPIFIQDNATRALGYALASAGGTLISCRRFDDGNWAAATNSTQIHGAVIFEVN